MIDQSYSVPDDEKLFESNAIAHFFKLAKDIRDKANNQNLFTVEACSQ